MWEVVRNRRLGGLKFRRQVSIDRYVVDFACVDARLVVELDGPFHDAEHDAGRTRVIEAKGWLVLRFASKDVINGDINVCAEILRHVEVCDGAHPVELLSARAL